MGVRKSSIVMAFTMLATIGLAGCSYIPNIFGSRDPAAVDVTNIPKVYVEDRENPVPGTVNGEWEEQMHDYVKVPGQLDPEGVYYRPPHDELVQIRSGRYQRVQYPMGGANHE